MVQRSSPAAGVAADSARPGLGRLSLIALFCFGVGLAWPLLAGLDFVQRPPGSSPAKAEEPEPAPAESEPDPKQPSSPPPSRPSSPVRRDEGVRAAAHVAPIAKARAPEDADVGDRLVAMSGQATIGWKQALVREGPSGSTETLDRLSYGARVSVTGRKGDWYRVKYGRKARAGWVHRKALGL